MLLCLIIQDWSEALLVHWGMRIQTEVKADVNGRQFIPKLLFSLQQREMPLCEELRWMIQIHMLSAVSMDS